MNPLPLSGHWGGQRRLPLPLAAAVSVAGWAALAWGLWWLCRLAASA